MDEETKFWDALDEWQREEEALRDWLEDKELTDGDD